MPIPAAPTLLLAVGGVALILSRWVRSSRWYEGVWLAAMLAAAWLIITGDIPPDTVAAGDVPRLIWSTDPFSVATQWLALVMGALFGIGSFGIRSLDVRTAERLGFLCFLIAGAMLVGSANDLVTMALSAEIVQFASWALRKIDRLETADRQRDLNFDRRHDSDRQHDSDSNGQSPPRDEVCLWLGIATSCCLWLGIALLANVTASTQFDEIRQTLTDAYVPGDGHTVIGAGSKLGLLAIGLIVAGLGARIGLVPWHVAIIEGSRHVGYWTAGCVLVGGQLTGVLGLARLCGYVWVGYRDEMLVMLLVVAGLTCVVSGALAGLGLMNGEGRLRRWATSIPMLHAAWLTVGLMASTSDLATPAHSLAAAGGQPGSLALLLFALGASQLGLAGLFLLFSYLSRDGREVEFIDELLGLGRLQPVTAAALLVVLASLIGQPPLWGFWANWLLMVAGLNVRAAGGHDGGTPHAGLILLLIATTTATLLTAGVVIRFARVMLLEQPIARTLPQGRRASLVTGCGCAVLLLVIGLFPARLLSVLSEVRVHATKPGTLDPTGSNRGAATARLP